MSNLKLPAGFKAVSGLGQSWKPKKKGETVQGILRNIRTVKIAKKGKQPAREWRIAVITTDSGDVEIGESAGVRALFDQKKGSRVAVQYLGLRKIPGRPQPMRDFVVGVK